MNYAEIHLIYRNTFTSPNTLKNYIPTNSAEKCLKRFKLPCSYLPHKRLLSATQSPQSLGCATHSLVPVLACSGHSVRRGWFGWEVQCLSVHVPLSSEHRQTLLLHPLPSSREICSEEPSHKSKPSSQKSKQEKAGRAADWRACQCTLKYLLIANLLSHCAASSCSDSREMSDEFQIELITSSLGCPGKKRQQQHHHWFCFLFFLPFLFPHSIGVICSA